MKLSEDDVRTFRDRGVLVVKNVFSPEEIASARAHFEATLLKYGVEISETGGGGGGGGDIGGGSIGNGIGKSESKTSLSKLRNLSTTGGSGGILDIFYEEWKLKMNEHPNVMSIFSQLWSLTFASATDPTFQHPFGPFDPSRAYMYIDRVCYRVSDKISQALGERKSEASSKIMPLQRSLTPHLDCCPHKMYDYSDKVFPKWRPIQAFVSLTDTYNAEEGGFEACSGHHLLFDDWAKQRKGSGGPSSSITQTSSTTTSSAAAPSPTSTSTLNSTTSVLADVNYVSKIPIASNTNLEKVVENASLSPPPPLPLPPPPSPSASPPPPCVGQFTPIRPLEDRDVLINMKHVPCGAGDLVLWDNRIPHSNSRHNLTDRAREVVYIGMLPDVEVNRKYAHEQRRRYYEGLVPTDQWHSSSRVESCNYGFSELGRKLMTIDPWCASDII